MKWVALATAVLLTLSSPVAAAACWDETRDSFAAKLLSNFKEVTIFIGETTGLAEGGRHWVTEVFANPKRTTWTIISYVPGRGAICLVASGLTWSPNTEL